MSATCDYCDLVMDPGAACTLPAYDDMGNGEAWARIPSTDDGDCHDCNTPPGGLHHPGCDAERCPNCKGQAISCGCAVGAAA